MTLLDFSGDLSPEFFLAFRRTFFMDTPGLLPDRRSEVINSALRDFLETTPWPIVLPNSKFEAAMVKAGFRSPTFNKKTIISFCCVDNSVQLSVEGRLVWSSSHKVSV